MHTHGEGGRRLTDTRGQLQLHTAQNLHTEDCKSHQHVRQNHASGRYSLCCVGTTVSGTASTAEHVAHHGHCDDGSQDNQLAEEEGTHQRLQSRGNDPTPHTCGRDAGVRGRRVAGENIQERVPGSTQCLHRRMRCARHIGCLAGLTRLSDTGLGRIGLRCDGRLTGLCGGCLSLCIRLCISVCLSGLRRLLRLDGLLRLSNLSYVTRLSRQRSVLRGVHTGIVAVASCSRCALRRVVGSVLRH